jgi:hypothetical protein
MKCNNFNKNGITIFDALAYSADGKMLCKKCGKYFSLSKVGSFLYKFLEGFLILCSIFYSFYLYSAWPLVFTIIISLFLRVFLLPYFAHQVNNEYSWRVKKKGSSTK